MSHTQNAGSSHVTQKDNRSALIHIRVKPVLRETIEQDAKAKGIKPSVVVRDILVAHYEGR